MFTGFVAGIAIGIGFVLLIVPGLFLLTIWALVAPVVVIERKGVMASLERSRELVRGHGWQVFAVIVVLLLLNLVLSGVVAGDPHSAQRRRSGLRGVEPDHHVLIGPLSALAAAVLYFELCACTARRATRAGPCRPPSAPRFPRPPRVRTPRPGQPAPDPAPPPPARPAPTTPDPRPAQP